MKEVHANHQEVRLRFPRQPTVRSVDFLLKAIREVRAVEGKNLILDLSQTAEISAIFICFLCGLVDLAFERNNKVRIILPRNKRVAVTVRAVQLLSRVSGPPHIQITDRMCQLRKFVDYNMIRLDEMLALISAHQPLLKASLQDSVRLILTELLTNALHHSGEKQAYACVGIWGRPHHLHIAFLDFGVGIPAKLRTRYPKLAGDNLAIRALLEKGLTTRQHIEGGRGYRYIQDILKTNGGRLHIFTGKAKVTLLYDRREYVYRRARQDFIGTCVDFQVNLKGPAFYDVLKESSEEPLF